MSPITASVEALRYELVQERIARQRAQTRLADCQRQLADARRELHWLHGSTTPAGSRLRWTADDQPDLNKVVC